MGRAVASDTRGPRFESSHWQLLSDIYLFTVNCIEKTKIKKKRPRMALSKKQFGNMFADFQTYKSNLFVCFLEKYKSDHGFNHLSDVLR